MKLHMHRIKVQKNATDILNNETKFEYKTFRFVS